MTGHYLADLDELVILCRTPEAQKYITEALACYRAGAFRACIITTWIAVVFDFLSKLRELELSGDAQATSKLQEFERRRANADIRGALDFERGVLESAKNEFELISPVEYEDLKRLLDDRNRCAHPSMRTSDEPYEPTAELARFHVRNAVTSLLQHPPVQGKAALGRLENDLGSAYFPDNWQDVQKAFQQGPLNRPRPSLVRNFTIVLLKRLFSAPENDPQVERRFLAALVAVAHMHREIVQHTLMEKLNDFVRQLGDKDLIRVFHFLQGMVECWDFLGEDTRQRLGNYVARAIMIPSPDFLSVALDIAALRDKALERIGILDVDELCFVARSHPRQEIIEPGVLLYERAESFADANSLSTSIIIPFASKLDHDQVERIFRAAMVNSQVGSSNELPNVLRAIRESNVIPPDEFHQSCEALFSCDSLDNRPAFLARLRAAAGL